jgi:hypothetical protein
MRSKTVLCYAMLAAFAATLVVGCYQSDEVRLAPAPPAELSKPEPLPNDAKKGGGPGSSGHMKGNPGGNT